MLGLMYVGAFAIFLALMITVISWGFDRITDSDGLGSIFVQGLGTLTGAGANKVAEGIWQTEDKRVNYSLVAVSATSNDLYITFSDRPDVIAINGWKPSAGQNLGITFPDTPYVPQTNAVYAGDLGQGGNDGLAGGNSADVIDGGAGNDLLLGSTGRDILLGGAGNDLIFGSAVGEFTMPRDVNFAPPAVPARVIRGQA